MNDSSASASAPAAQSAQQAASIDDATLQKAAKAYVKVKKIVHETKQASPTSASAAPDQAKIAAVKDSGLDPQQYNQVIQTVQADPQLQQKFASYVTQNGGDTD
jgi:hypothetical protein